MTTWQVTFTGTKDASRSSGAALGVWLRTDVSGGGQAAGQNGDMFLDYSYALVANAQAGWNSAGDSGRDNKAR